MNGVSISIRCIPRDPNNAADVINKITDHDDYAINDIVFNVLDDLWYPLPAIGSLARITRRFSVSIPDFFNPV